MTKDYHVPESSCPGCGKPLDGALGMGQGRPEPGDVTITICCHHIAVFDDHMRLRNPTDAEMVEIAGDRRIILAQRLLAEAKGAVS